MKYTALVIIFLFHSVQAQEMELPFPEPEQVEIQETAVAAEAASEPATAEPVTVKAPLPKKPVVKAAGKKEKEKKKKKEGEGGDELAYKLGRMQLKSGNAAQAEAEFSKAGDDESKTQLMMIKVKNGKLDEAAGLVDTITDAEKKSKARLILANSLASDTHKPEAVQAALSQYYRIIAEETSNVPAAMWGASMLFYKKQDYKPALDYLTRIILEFPESEYLDDAYYLSGKIFETRGKYSNPGHAKQFYKLFLDNLDKEHFRNSIYKNEVKRRMKQLP